MTTDLMTVFAISMLGAWFGMTAPSRSRTLWNTPKPNLLGFLIPCVVMILYAGLRNTIGDTSYYIHMLEVLEENGNPLPVWGGSSFLFSAFQYLSIVFGGENSSHLFIMVSSLLTYIPVFLIFRKYSPDFFLTLFFYFVTGTYFSAMNGIRQYIAAGIVILATKYLFSEKKSSFIKFLVFVAVASLFHNSALIMIPVYFLCRKKAWSVSTFIMVIGGVAALVFVSLFLPQFMEIIEDTSYSQYNEGGWFTEGIEGGTNILRVLFHAIPMILSAIFYKELKHYGPVVDILINLSVFHFAIYIVSLYNWIFARFAFYTYVYMCILLAFLFFTVLKDARQRWLKICLYAAYILFFILESQTAYMYKSDFFEPNNTIWFMFIYQIFLL